MSNIISPILPLLSLLHFFWRNNSVLLRFWGLCFHFLSSKKNARIWLLLNLRHSLPTAKPVILVRLQKSIFCLLFRPLQLSLELSVHSGASLVVSEKPDILSSSQQICFYFLVLIALLIPNFRKLWTRLQKSGDELKKKILSFKGNVFGEL